MGRGHLRSAGNWESLRKMREASLPGTRALLRRAGVSRSADRLARQQGYVETLMKRRRYIPEIKEPQLQPAAYGERNAQNSPLQGSAADLIKLAMVRSIEPSGSVGLPAACCSRCTTN